MSSLRLLKKAYDKLKNDRLRSAVLDTAERLHIPKNIIRMDLNGFCNIRCVMCNQSNRSEKKKFMSLEQFKRIMDMFAPTTRMLYLSCAYEPLITPHFTDYLKYAKSKKIPHISFCTNALLMNEEIISCLVDQEIDEIIISFNGFRAESYNRIMDGSDFNRVCANLKALAAYKQKKHADKPHIRMNTILMKSNLLEFEDMFHFLKAHDIETIQFRELVHLDGQNNLAEVQKELVSNLTQEAYEQTAARIKDMAQQLRRMGKEVILPAEFGIWHAPLPPPADEPTAQEEAKEDGLAIDKKCNRQKHSCSIPCFSYWIDRDGGVRICGYDDNGIIGNAISQNYKELLNKRRIFRKMALSGECSSELCTINVDSSTVL